jgi:eukaryotic-like serine/threonine-protein kinase
VLGVGGMGEVRAVRDQRLDREVALKVARDPAGEAAMVVEARLTAHLDHPGIVRVYGAGRLPDGRAYYTMPVLRGRTLQEAIDSAPDGAARLRLLRHLLDACGAVSAAHDKGVLHRDLKPQNILIGAHGETQVADWGLATRLEADGLSKATAAVGTPGFCAPEQASGERLGPQADVYSLGVCLQRLLGDEPAPELQAVARRATAVAAGERYADASALSADLLAWFEGRQVQAHSYSPRELLGRLLVAWRLPLRVGLFAMLILGVVLGLAARDIVAQRNLALEAGRQAAASRDAAQDSLAHSLGAQALGAAARGDRARAEVLAAHALLSIEDPDVRGVLVRFASATRPLLRAHQVLPGCQATAVSPDGRSVLCATAAAVHWFGPDDQTALLPVKGDDLAFVAGPAPLAVAVGSELQLWSPDQASPTGRLPLAAGSRLVDTLTPDKLVVLARGTVQVLDRQTGASTRGSPCPSHLGVRAVTVDAAGGVTQVCAGGTADRTLIMQGQLGSEAIDQVGMLLPGDGPPSAVAREGRRLIVGTEGGEVLVGDLDLGRWRRLSVGSGAVVDLALSGDRVAIASSQGDIEVWGLGDLVLHARLPSAPARVRWLPDGRLRVVGARIEDWEVPAIAGPWLVSSGAGISAVAVSPDGRSVASAHGDGTLVVTDLERGTLRWQQRLGDSVIKDVAWSPDGSQLIAGAAQVRHAWLLDAADGMLVGTLPCDRVRRVAWTAAGPSVAPYGGPLLRFGNGPVPLPVPDARDTIDLEAVAGTGRLLALQEDGRLLEVDGAATRLLRTEPAAQAVAGWGDDRYLLQPLSLERLDGAGATIASADLPASRAVDLAVSADGVWVAVGHLDGQITLWRSVDLSLVAVLRGHEQRVAAMAFDPKGAVLVSGGWDGMVRQWGLQALTAGGDSYVAALEAGWGRDLSSLLRP